MSGESGTDSWELDFSEDRLFPTSLVLTAASASYLALRGWNSSYIGSEVEVIYNYREAVTIEELHAQLEKSADTLLFFREIGGKVWRIEAQYRNQGMHISAVPVLSAAALSRLSQDYQLGQTPAALLRKAKVETLLLREFGGRVTVESISGEVSHYTGLIQGSEVSAAWSSLCHLNPERVALECLRSGTGIRYLDTYVRGGRANYLLLEYLPIRHSENHVAVALYPLKRDEYYALQLPYVDFLPQMAPLKSSAAYGMFEHDGERFVPRRYNRAFSELIKRCAPGSGVADKLLLSCRAAGGWKCSITAIGGVRYFCVAASAGAAIHLYLLPFNEFQSGLDERLRILSPREREIATCILDGLSNREIAKKLVIAEGTVKKTISNIYAKLGVNSKYDLLHLVLQYK